MKKEIDKMYEQEPKTWYAKILVALIVAALLAWSMSTVQSGTTGGDGLTVAGKIISGIFHPDTALLFNFTTSGVAYLLLETMSHFWVRLWEQCSRSRCLFWLQPTLFRSRLH